MKCDPTGEYEGIPVIRLTKQQFSDLKNRCRYQSVGFTKKAPYFAPNHNTFNVRARLIVAMENKLAGWMNGFTKVR